jgi:hypothetical protein
MGSRWLMNPMRYWSQRQVNICGKEQNYRVKTRERCVLLQRISLIRLDVPSLFCT